VVEDVVVQTDAFEVSGRVFRRYRRKAREAAAATGAGAVGSPRRAGAPRARAGERIPPPFRARRRPTARRARLFRWVDASFSVHPTCDPGHFFHRAHRWDAAPARKVLLLV